MENTQFQTASNQSSQTKQALLGQASMFEVLANRSCLTPLIPYRSRMRFPKIALSAISAFVIAIWLFPNTVKEHPVLSNYIDFDSPASNIVWLYILITAGMFWFITWRKEDSARHFQESLKTESVQNNYFIQFTKTLERNSFTLEHVVDFLLHRNNRLASSPAEILFGRHGRMDLPLAHATAEVIIERALKREAIVPCNMGAISTEYRLISANNSSNTDAVNSYGS